VQDFKLKGDISEKEIYLVGLYWNDMPFYLCYWLHIQFSETFEAQGDVK